MNLVPGTLFANDYRVVRPLSVGGMGALFVVDQLSTGKQRALKLMHRELVYDPTSRQRFEQEARVGSRISSEHVVEVQAAGVDAQTQLPYLVMELLEGEDLSARLKRGAVPLAEAASVFEQVAHALGAAHDAGVVHRDLKPENIFLAVSRRSGEARVVKVLDFGIAKVIDDQRRTTGAFGTPMWLAPEQTRAGEVTPAADVWSFALVVFATLTGHVFWRSGESADASLRNLIEEILNAPIPSASSRAAEFALRLPIGIDAWFHAALQRDPRARFPNVRAAYAALAPHLATTSAPAEPSSPVATPKPKGGGGVVIALVVAVALLFVLVIGGGLAAFFALRDGSSSSSSSPVVMTTSAPSSTPSILATAPPEPSASVAGTIAITETHVIPFVYSADTELQSDAQKQINETLAAALDGCLASHPKHAPKASVALMVHVEADGAVKTVSSYTAQPHPAVQCMVEIVKAAKFVSRKKASDLIVNVSWQ